MKLTSEKLLRSMDLGRRYCIHELADRFDVPTSEVNDMLCMLAEDGLVRMNSHSTRIIRFERLSSESGTSGPTFG
jgi:DNA-binding GntR family transcriptional regulator